MEEWMNSKLYTEREIQTMFNTSIYEDVAESDCQEYRLDEIDESQERIVGDKLLTAEEEKALALKIRQGDNQSRDKLILSNSKLVEFIAKKYVGRGVEYEDLVQSGQIGLIKATDKYDPDKGNRFSTCAIWWIRKEILKTLCDNGRTIRIPEHFKEKFDKVIKAKVQYEDAKGTSPSIEELIEITKESEQNIKKSLFLALPTVSIYDYIGDSDDELCAWLKDDGESPDEKMERENLYSALRKSLEQLDEREKIVIKLRFGLDGDEIKSQQSIAEILGVTRQYIRQIEDKALKKLRYPMIIESL